MLKTIKNHEHYRIVVHFNLTEFAFFNSRMEIEMVMEKLGFIFSLHCHISNISQKFNKYNL